MYTELHYYVLFYTFYNIIIQLFPLLVQAHILLFPALTLGCYYVWHCSSYVRTSLSICILFFECVEGCSEGQICHMTQGAPSL